MAEEKNQMEHPKIFGAIAAVIADVGAVAKDKVNTQQGFKYRSVDDVFNALHPALAKNKVFIVPRILEQQREAAVTKSGSKMTLVICKIKFTFYAEDGSHIESIIIGEGLDTGDKATNKAMAIAYKYACFQVFCIPTEEMVDPDSERPEMADESKKDEKKNADKKEKKPEKSLPETEPTAGSEKITQAMLNTIREEQKRTGVSDELILKRKFVKAKRLEDVTIEEFKGIMQVFERTKDLKQKEEA